MSPTMVMIVGLAATFGLGIYLLLAAVVPQQSDLVATLRQPRRLTLPVVAEVSEPGSRGPVMERAQEWIEQRI